jgi:hypothetical protein
MLAKKVYFKFFSILTTAEYFRNEKAGHFNGLSPIIDFFTDCTIKTHLNLKIHFFK